jgi:hypothetical protein
LLQGAANQNDDVDQRLLWEKTSEVREQELEALVDFMAGQMVVPSAVDTQMAQRLAARHARVLNEFQALIVV